MNHVGHIERCAKGIPQLPTTPPAPAVPSRGNCDPAYPDVCIPPHPPDLDCGDVAPHGRFRVLALDPHQLTVMATAWAVSGVRRRDAVLGTHAVGAGGMLLAQPSPRRPGDFWHPLLPSRGARGGRLSFRFPHPDAPDHNPVRHRNDSRSDTTTTPTRQPKRRPKRRPMRHGKPQWNM